MHTLHQLAFSNRYARLATHFYSRVYPTPLPDPYLISFNADAARLLGLGAAEARRDDFAAHFSGNRLPLNAEPLAMLYAGHQFGHFVPQLGDGRAIMLGGVHNQAGEYWEVQLKGSGITPYSRGGDGRAVLRSSIREYLCSEAMHGLGIPTSRALCIVGSDEQVYREKIETAAVLTRLAPSHIRFGSFEVFFYRGQYEHIKTLADFVIENYYPEFMAADEKYCLLLREVARRTAKLMAQWQSVGFCHGVMNTDNMSILGLTLDYGPFGFMENYNPAHICNHSDPQGRYAYNQQPQVGLWNLSCLAQALSRLVSEADIEMIMADYAPIFYQHFVALMGGKLGLKNPQTEDFSLIEDWLKLLHENHLDFTNSFRVLSDFSGNANRSALRDQCLNTGAFDAWAEKYRARLQRDECADAERKARMNALNPKYILRNYLAQNAIARAENQRDFSEIERLLALLRKPYDEQPEMQRYAQPAPETARHIMVSCSS